MPLAIKFLPEVEAEELSFLQNMYENLSESQAQFFASMYRARRRDPMLILICTLVGFLGLAGIQRFITGQIGMGILYLLTLGLCFIGTIIDAVNYKQMTFEYNRKMAFEVLSMIKAYKVE